MGTGWLRTVLRKLKKRLYYNIISSVPAPINTHPICDMHIRKTCLEQHELVAVVGNRGYSIG